MKGVRTSEISCKKLKIKYMELKKTPRADLENKKGLFAEIGLVVILAAALVAFNIKSYDQKDVKVEQREATSEVEEKIIQTQELETPPPPPEPEVPEVVTKVNVVENDAEIKNELGPVDMSADNAVNTEVQHVEVTKEVEVEEEEVLVFVEENPEYPGGDAARMKFLAENMKYPPAARDNGIQGKVYIQFVVEKDGRITNARVLRDIGGGCGAEALRVVKSMPKWKPGKQQGRAVRSQFTLPVQFTLK